MVSKLSYFVTNFSIATIVLTTIVSGEIGDIVCHYTTVSPSAVNYYTCFDLASKYEITIEKFFLLNPSVDVDCDTIDPETEYCVRGCELICSHVLLS